MIQPHQLDGPTLARFVMAMLEATPDASTPAALREWRVLLSHSHQGHLAFAEQTLRREYRNHPLFPVAHGIVVDALRLSGAIDDAAWGTA